MAACIALVILAGIESLLHAQADTWFPRAKTGDFRSDSIDECIFLAEQPTKLRLAVVGSSISGAVKAGALSHQVMGKAEQTGANFVMFSANPQGVERLLTTVVLARQTPDFLILPISSRDVNDSGRLSAINRAIPDLESYAHSPVQHRLARMLARHFYLWRYREGLKGVIYGLLQPKTKGTIAGSLDDTSAHVVEHREFSVQPASWKAVRHCLQLARNRGITAVLVSLPVNPSQATATYLAGESRWLEDFVEFARNEHCLFISADKLDLTSNDYRDAHHLNQTGSERITRVVGQVLSEQLQP